MKNLNFTIVEGNLTRDPEQKETEAGLSMCRFTIANNNSYKKDGEWTNKVNYLNVVTWAKTATTCGQFLKKGSPVRIKGRIDQHTYKNQEGKNVNVVELVAQSVDFMPRKKSNNEIEEKAA